MEKQYYRTFIALPVRVGDDLLSLRQELMHSLKDERISWVDPKNFHVTLSFLGDTLPGDVDRISQALREGKHVQKSMSVTMSGVRSFGPERNPRVIWAALGQESWFRAIKESVDGLLDGLGLPQADHSFTPHLTLARIRRLRQISSYLEIMEGIKTKSLESVCFDRLVYYRSELGSGAPEYKELAEILLKSK